MTGPTRPSARAGRPAAGPWKPPIRKRFGQHFLEAAWVAKLVAAIQPRPDDLFLEIGGGRGELTRPLARAGARVVVVEIDRLLAARLAETLPTTVQVVTGDILEQNLPALLAAQGPDAPPARLVGNIPYNLSSPILRLLVTTQRRAGCFTDATLLLQREVADRLVGRPGTRDYGPLAIEMQLVADVERVLTLPPGAFRPPPKVRSAVVRLRFRPSPVAIRHPALFDRLVRALFTQRRKTILNGLAPMVPAGSRLAPAAILAHAGLASERRPATLELADLARLSEALAEAVPVLK
ncbi:MAG: 16S rRNA (adenine(1518)-N(6)/adenine(1519)-N(6))-dimethyltransferase RsmA [Acidobacteria bacterium]|nr:16S rRNA (adenine(1518)-N(6)/adenine(1519)-N(6))-dimethyltransferase RsmA [Acidobacteriota bacterium]